jgi:HSP20 family protein
METNKNKELLSPVDFFEKLIDKAVNLSQPNWEDFFTAKKQTPSVNIIQTEKGVSLEMAIPGCDKKDVEISLEKNLLTISCKKEESKQTFTRKEFSYHSFTRSFNLADSLDKDNIKSYMENGVLTIEVGKLNPEANKLEKKTIPVE